MKKLPTLLFCCVSSFAIADSLAPVIDNSNYPVGAPAQMPVPAVPVNSTFELMSRLDEAQSEIQQLHGKLEEQAYLIAELKKKQSSMYADFDDRLQQVESKLSGAKPAVTEAPVAESTESTPPTKSAASSEPAASAGSSDEKKQPYQQAFEALRNGQVTQAIEQFNTLLDQDPKNIYANNAQFWLGKAYRISKDSASAKKAFSALLEKYPSSQKVPEALVELGAIEAEQKNSAKAKEYLTRVITDFPTSKSAELAAKKLQQLNGTPN